MLPLGVDGDLIVDGELSVADGEAQGVMPRPAEGNGRFGGVAMGEDGFWQDPVRQAAMLTQLPAYRLSKFQRALPTRYSVEMVGDYLLDIPNCLRFLNQYQPS